MHLALAAAALVALSAAQDAPDALPKYHFVPTPYNWMNGAVWIGAARRSGAVRAVPSVPFTPDRSVVDVALGLGLCWKL
jgi:hypothetical protein